MKPELEQIDLSTSSKSFQFFQFEKEELNPFWHYHPELELTFIKKGKGTRFIGDTIAPFTNYDLVLVGENLPHQWVTLNAEKTLNECFVFQFKKEIIPNLKECKPIINLLEEAKRGIQFLSVPQFIIQKILNFNSLNTVQQFGELLDILNDLQQIESKKLLTSPSYEIRQRNVKNQEKFAKINSYILENLNQKLTVNEMAEIANMVPQSFCRWFKSISGFSFISFLNIARIEKASQLLITTSQPIQEVAFASGFETLSHFNRTFKKIKNTSPREFRNSDNQIINI